MAKKLKIAGASSLLPGIAWPISLELSTHGGLEPLTQPPPKTSSSSFTLERQQEAAAPYPHPLKKSQLWRWKLTKRQATGMCTIALLVSGTPSKDAETNAWISNKGTGCTHSPLLSLIEESISMVLGTQHIGLNPRFIPITVHHSKKEHGQLSQSCTKSLEIDISLLINHHTKPTRLHPLNNPLPTSQPSTSF